MNKVLDVCNVSGTPSLRLLRHEEIELAAHVVGRGMCNNPVNVAVFRIPDAGNRTRALGRFFVRVLQGLYRRGFIIGAFRSQDLIGVCGFARPGFCQPRMLEKMRVLPAAVIGNPAPTPLRLLHWVGEWSKLDPAEPHWHLGPVAVEPQLQHQGIGTAMLDAFCTITDGFHSLAYLETDKEENVRLYRRFGFRVIYSAKVLGVPNWFMSRAPQAKTVSQSMLEPVYIRNPNEGPAASDNAAISYKHSGLDTL
jgi:ribosomal protein S18 acetylase RimI-like enzyme